MFLSSRLPRAVLAASSLSLCFFAAAPLARANVRMPAIFGDHMVLQQDIRIPVWGWADPGEKITVTLGNESGQAVTGTDGDWRVDLPAIHANSQGQKLTVAGANTISFDDVLVGDVWIASGQSNMEFGIQSDADAAQTIPKASDPQLRLYVVPISTSLEPKNDIAPQSANSLSGKWEVCTPALLNGHYGWNGFSAVGYYFARQIRENRGYPIGMIATYKGGTPAQAWTSIPALEKKPVLDDYVEAHQALVKDFAQAEAAYPAKLDTYRKVIADWNKTVLPSYQAAMTQWKTAADQAQAAGQPTPPPPEPSRRRPPSPTAPDGGTNPPGNLFNAMVSPLIPYGIKGVIWYQGESNADDLNQAELYATLFPTMIQDWRTRWGEGDFPFLYVQLAGFKSGGATCVWPWLRESQQDTLSLPATGMATAVDIGNPTDIHPKDKLDVGLRLALVARRVAYGENVVASGPARTLSAVLGNKIRIQFDQQVMLGQPPWTPPGVTPPSTAAPTDFLIAGADEKFLPAQAKLDHDSVTVWNDTISQPVAVRYDWSNSPDGNLYDTHGLPALPFRTDHWEPGPIENLAVIPQPQSGAGWVQKFRENVARVKGARVDLIFDGDSITDWFQTTGKPVWQQFYAGRHATDFAIAGDRTDHLLWRLDHGQVDGLDPKLVVLLIGTNNTIRDSSGQIATGVQACVNEYLKRCPHARILLLALFPRRTPADLLRLKVDAVNAKLAATHFDDRVTYLDIGKIFLKGQEKINLSLVPGRLHPNLAGYQAWAEAMEPAISRLLPADAAH